ncbi:MAG: YceI family protein [Bacteroidetes bacterium]|nr:YceI family protein [Bacteroidota bacterium]
MKKNIILSIVIVLAGLMANAQTKYKADLTNSKITWLGKKITGEHNGTINLSDGEYIVTNNKLSKAVFKIDMKSIKDLDLTDEGYKAKLEGHLKSDDFFGVEKFPTASFVMDKTILIQKGTTFISGNITIKGVTQPIVIKTVITETPEGQRIYANITIDRTKFNLKYGSGSFFDNLGDKTIYDDFNISLNLLMKKQ